MKNIFFLTTIFLATFLITSCDDDESPMVTDFDYHAHVITPNTDDKHVDDNLAIKVEFESHTGETVHHVNVRIYNKADNTEIYNKPDAAHVHGTTGMYEFEDDFVLSNANGVAAHTDWILEARVWGDEAGLGEVVETVEFHVHP